jgi:hypothetical protein
MVSLKVLLQDGGGIYKSSSFGGQGYNMPVMGNTFMEWLQEQRMLWW